MSDISATGAENFLALSKALKAAGRGDLRKELNKGVRAAARPLLPKVRTAFRTGLPQRGGLAETISKRPLRVKVSTNASTAGVSIVAAKTDVRIDQGRVAHPVFGRKPMVLQHVRAGLFSNTLQAEAPAVQQEIVASIQRMADRVAGSS